VYEATTYLTLYGYNFRRPVRTLRDLDDEERFRRPTPAIAAGLGDRVWSLAEWLALPAVHRK
jgi:hypothetical protein